MAKRKSTAKKATKKDLEDKIAELEAKLSQLSSKLEPSAAKPAEAKASPPPPPPPKPQQKPAETPKPAPKEQAPPPVTLESSWYSVPVGNWHAQKTKTPGYVSENPRAWARRHAVVGEAPTQPWALQKTKVTGYTAASNQYFATRQRLAYSPADKKFGSFSSVKMSVEGVKLQDKKPEPPKEAPKPKGTLPKGF